MDRGVRRPQMSVGRSPGNARAASGFDDVTGCSLYRGLVPRIGTVERRDVADSRIHAETEEVAEATDIYTTGADLVEDAVIPYRPRGDAELSPHPEVPDRADACGRPMVDEQVGVGACWANDGCDSPATH